MFYNYDHNIKQEIYPMPPLDTANRLNNCSAAKILTNVKGDELGIAAKINSKFYLYFSVWGEVIDDDSPFASETLREVLENAVLHFDVLDSKREVVASFEPELCEYANEIRVKVYTSEEGPLKYGVYRMHLYFENEEGIYTLFSEEDGILSIE